MGQELQMALYGPKDIMGHRWAGSYNGLESYWMAQMKLMGLIPIGLMGRELAGINGIYTNRPLTGFPWAGLLPFDQDKQTSLLTGMGLSWVVPRVDVSYAPPVQ